MNDLYLCWLIRTDQVCSLVIMLPIDKWEIFITDRVARQKRVSFVNIVRSYHPFDIIKRSIEG